MAAAFATRDRNEWLNTLHDADACVEPVLDVYEALTSDLARERGIDMGATAAVAALGEHTQEVLAEAGLSPADIAAVV
jgi:crotonobetainyl-CoA:carnitine CoA-transferase CaiB-like acyl-CoA transferase